MSLIAVVPSPFRESHTASGAFLSLWMIHAVHASPCACKPGSVLELFPLHLLNLKPQAAPFSHSEAQFVQSNLMVGRGKKKKKNQIFRLKEAPRRAGKLLRCKWLWFGDGIAEISQKLITDICKQWASQFIILQMFYFWNDLGLYFLPFFHVLQEETFSNHWGF